MTGVIADNIYAYMESNNKLPEEQKGCRRKCRGTKDQLLIDKMILKDCKSRQKNLAMVWVDYRKAYDMVPYSWILECLHLVQVLGQHEGVHKEVHEKLANRTNSMWRGIRGS